MPAVPHEHFSMTHTEILMSPLDYLPDSDSVRFHFRLGLSVRSLLVHMEPININDNSQYIDFIGSTLFYVMYVMS